MDDLKTRFHPQDGDSDEGYSAEEDSDEEERREQEERKRREEEEREKRIAEEKRIDMERQAERERRQNMSLRDMEYERQMKQRKEAGGDQWSSWWNQEMATVPDKQVGLQDSGSAAVSVQGLMV